MGHDEDKFDDEMAMKYMMHGGQTIFVSPKYVFEHGSDGGILFINSPPASMIYEWNSRGIDVLSTGYGPKIVPIRQATLILSTDPTACGGTSLNLNGKDDVIVVVSKWSHECNFFQRMENIQNSGASAALFTFHSNYIYSIGHSNAEGSGKTKLKSKTQLENLGLSHPYAIRIPTLIMTRNAGEALSKYLKLRGNVHAVNDAMLNPDFHLQDKWNELLKLRKPQSWPSEDDARRRLYFRLLKVHGREVATGSHDRHCLVEESYQESGSFWKLMKEERRFTDL